MIGCIFLCLRLDDMIVCHIIAAFNLHVISVLRWCWFEYSLDLGVIFGGTQCARGLGRQLYNLYIVRFGV